MENASKALIIAGAILISILLISVGILVMNSTGNMQDEVGKTADTMATQTFNSQFTTYEGDSIRASQVKSLLSLIKSSNASNEVSVGDDKYVTATGVTSTSTLSTNKTYTVEITGYSPGGYVSQITISEN